jgi:O-acetyl-ADP-ribose deacetylase (regulator of RNase III)
VIRFVRGDILRADADALVNAVNCVGVMGRGLALQFKRAFPDVFKAYAAACRAGDIAPGRMHLVVREAASGPRLVINFPTKRHWRDKARLSDIESGLHSLVTEVRARKVRTVAVPALGCGLGGLEWGDVRPRIELAFAPLRGVSVLAFEPDE